MVWKQYLSPTFSHEPDGSADTPSIRDQAAILDTACLYQTDSWELNGTARLVPEYIPINILYKHSLHTSSLAKQPGGPR